MTFELLSPDIHHIAEKLIGYFKRDGYKVYIEKPLWNNAPYRTTLVCKKATDTVVVEVRQNIILERYFEDFIDRCIIRQEPVKIFVAVEDDNTLSIPLETVKILREKGIGIIIIRDSKIEQHEKAVDCSMRIKLPVGSSLGNFTHRVSEAENKFNRGDYIDTIRDLTEMVEDVITKLAKKAAKKRKIILTESDIDSSNLEGKINALSAPQYKNQPQTRFFDEMLKLDLLSFKGARNLSHHPRTAKQRTELFRQAKERMFMGERLLRAVYSKLRF